MRCFPGLCVQLAMIWEATARKPGNVHRFRDLPDLHYVDFLASAAAVAPILDAAPRHRVGETPLPDQQVRFRRQRFRVFRVSRQHAVDQTARVLDLIRGDQRL